MSLNLGVINAAVTLDDSDYRKKLSGIESHSENTFKKVAMMAAGYLSFRALYSSGSMAIKTFSDMEEAANRFNTVYGNIKNTATETMQTLRKEFGLSRASAMEMLAGTGDLLTGFGFDQASALKLSDQAARLGADLYSFTNYAGGAKGATEALTKGMLGETESLKALGVVIRQDSDEYKNLVAQFQKTHGATEQQAKAMAVLEMATRQSINAIGDWNRPGETYAQVAQAAKENTKEFATILGGQFQNSVKGGIKGVNELLAGYNSLDPANQRMITGGVALAAGLLLTQTNAVKAANAKMILAGKYIATADAARLESVAVAAAEKQKELATARSVATRDMLEKRRHLTAMQNAAREASAALSQARAGGNQAAIVAAEKRYTAAKLEASKANAAFVVSSQAAKEAKRAEAVQTELTTKAQVVANRAKTAGGRAALILSGGLRTATAGLRAFFASLGPLGWAVLAFSAMSAIANQMNRGLEKASTAAGKAAENAGKMNEALDAGDRTRAADLDKIGRLQELTKYERLNNKEITEAKSLNDQLAKSYGVQVAAIDEATGALKLKAGAIEAINGAMREQRKLELEASYEAEVQKLDALRKEADAMLNHKMNFYQGIGNLFTGYKDEEMAELLETKGNEIATQMKVVQAKKLELKIDTITGDANGEAKKASEVERKAQEEIRKLEARIKEMKYDVEISGIESASEKLKALDMQMKDLIEEKLQARGDKKKELEIELKILSLERERNSLLKERKRETRDIQSMTRDNTKMFADRQQSLADQTLDRRVDKMLRDGDKTGAKSIMEQEYTRAKAAAAKMKSEYESAYKDAIKDGRLSDEEKQKLSELKSKWQEAIGREDKWSGKLYDQEKRDQSQKKTIVTFSAELLGLAAGSNSPQERTAKAVEKSQKTLQEIKDNTKPKTTTTQNNKVKAT